MGLPCGQTIAKCILFMFNFIIFLIGGLLLGVGVWLIMDKSSFLNVLKVVEQTSDNVSPLKEELQSPVLITHGGYILIGCGGALLIIGFLGCCGAIAESRLLLALYGLVLLAILILQIVAVALIMVYKDQAQTKLKGVLEYSLKESYTIPEEATTVTAGWNLLMAQLSCCGVDDYQDFNKAKKWMEKKDPNQDIPVACCKLKPNQLHPVPQDPQCITNPNKSNSNYMQGCHESILDWLASNSKIMIYIGICIGLVELAGVFFSFCVCQSLSDSNFK